ncbi:hypothetical protein [Mobiluncus mulieris]|uniref:Tail assembly chaperone n=2 Tax=Mobiluncus mulieris TaxID=2052 RepID=E0QRC6_9ACTO|nr:hypothetical protein [Mobiluncus mulieris]EFM46119.1 hypothetical protein HMPREF0580_1441 [Mobiluncus mulieris ATCC 35239]MCU9969425.1 hypothetical protein [Mobiluncus mulieris]MCU9970155.1 hypothetical protein [Mobiluncus mulieris]MCU9973864.1 hypothetical protein [Mobiluncus mulieris]MCU9993641.1 hypothetical protein [Mobiluncus mulieris]
MATKNTSRKKNSPRKPTLESLELEGSPEPFVYVTLSGEEIEFPSPLDMSVEQAENLLFMLKGDAAVSSKEVFTQWVGKEAAAKILADKPTYRQITAVSKQIVKYYESVLAPVGE